MNTEKQFKVPSIVIVQVIGIGQTLVIAGLLFELMDCELLKLVKYYSNT